jgi:hypothetical protein
VSKPLLKQFGDLTEADFAMHPVWINCHTADTDEAWYDETDEETFRPRGGDLPAQPSEGMLLVRATGTLRDGSRLPGFLTPAFEPEDLGTMQPQMFVGSALFSFWGGVLGISKEGRAAFYQAVGKSADQIFPIQFAADPGLAEGAASIQIRGFYKTSGKKVESEP